MNEITRILGAVERGEAIAADQLLPLVYDELRKLAAQKLANERPGQTLDATALVHEAYLRLIRPAREATGIESHWSGRSHFFAAAAEAMRRILVENARRKNRQKRGGKLTRHELDAANIAAPEVADHLLALDDALQALAETDPRAAKLVELRYFTGLSIDESAGVLGVSPRTADRLWKYARAWLHSKIYE